MLVEGMPNSHGRVDLLTEDDDQLVISNVKTARGKWSAEQVEDSGEQLLPHSHLASEISPGKMTGSIRPSERRRGPTSSTPDTATGSNTLTWMRV